LTFDFRLAVLVCAISVKITKIKLPINDHV
jgi:hypothetical protein